MLATGVCRETCLQSRLPRFAIGGTPTLSRQSVSATSPAHNDTADHGCARTDCLRSLLTLAVGCCIVRYVCEGIHLVPYADLV